jgi:DNA adenine methylase
VPHPIPYQGSKRLLAGAILARAGRRRFATLVEPFAGSAAITLAAAHAGLAGSFVIGDSLPPLIGIWNAILDRPDELADGYERLWRQQGEGEASLLHFAAVRERYNRDGSAPGLLYLLARCVKNAPRWNARGAFNQSPDRRRLGTRPERMRSAIAAASHLLAGRATALCGDFRATLDRAGRGDLVYLDPPWQGTTEGQDHRYHAGLGREALVEALAVLTRRSVPFLLSYDGRCGDRTYGPPLPDSLGATRMDLPAGRSSQATLLGRDEQTVESLYVSRGLL